MREQDLRSLWKSQPSEPQEFAVEELERRSRRFDQSVRRRNIREWVATAVLVPLCVGLSLYVQSVMGWGFALLALGLLVMAWHLRRHAERTQTELSLPLLTRYRRVLTQERDALASAWRWYLGPLVPGLAVFLGGYFLHVAPQSPRAFGTGVLTAVLILVTFAGIAWMNARAAAKLSAELSALEPLSP